MNVSALAVQAEQLRGLHVPGSPRGRVPARWRARRGRAPRPAVRAGEQLAELGVARVSFGSGLMHTAMDAAAARVEDFLAS